MAAEKKRALAIAIADDDGVACDLLEGLLTLMGHRVVSCAANGEELLGQVLLRETPPDLIITDALMPKMTGLEALARIWRERPTPAVVITGYGEFETHDAGGYLPEFASKPVTEEELRDRIRVAIERFTRERAVASERDELRRKREDGKTIRRAKDSIMRRTGVSDEEALARLHKLAGVRPLIDAAREVVAAERAFFS